MPTKYEWINLALFGFTIWWSQTHEDGTGPIILVFLVFATIIMYIAGWATGRHRDWEKRYTKKTTK